jgi:hypothetical protein
MTKGVLIELILQSVAGGVKTQDTGRYVRREDVEAYLAAAINYSLIKAYYINKAENEGIFPNDFIATYILDVEEDPIEGVKFVPLPTKILSLPANRGLRSVGPVKGNVQFIQQNFEAQAHDEYYKGSIRNMTGFRLIGQRIELVNLSSFVTQVKIRQVASIMDMDDEQELPIPAGMEVEVIQICTEFFTGVRALPKDNRPNNTEG